MIAMGSVNKTWQGEDKIEY